MRIKNLWGMLVAIMFVMDTVTAHATPITEIRNSVSPARVRFVLDSSAPVDYKVEEAGKKLVIQLPKSAAQKKESAG